MNFGRTPAIKISAVRTEGRDLELKSIFEHNDHAKVRAHRVRPRKHFLHIIRPRVRRNIDVLRNLAAQEIPHRATRVVRHMPGRAQSAHNITRGLFHRRSGLHGSASFQLANQTNASWKLALP